MHPVQQGTGNTTLAQVAELVDALVSNTNAFGRAGSIPALGTRNPFRCKSEGVFAFFGKFFRGKEFYVNCSLTVNGLATPPVQKEFHILSTCDFKSPVIIWCI